MRLNKGADIDVGQVIDRRGPIGRLGAGLSGWAIGLILSIAGRKGGLRGIVIALIVLFLGSLGVHAITNRGDNSSIKKECSASNATDQLDCRNVLYINSIQDYWTGALPKVFGVRYTKADTVFFSGRTSTGCGEADSGTGPFYCSADKLVYLDLTFYHELADKLGAPGEFAQPYVLAHEYGHHVQDLVGTEAAMRRAQKRNPDDANKLSVMLELQADCYAGVWAKNATGTDDAQGHKIFESITDEDIQQGLDTAAAIGDDTLQKEAGRPVDEQGFTHGSSADREEWFRTGHDSGDPKSCDTFGNAI
jgi:predicted metalloprotease